QGPARHRDHVRDDQRGRRLPGDRPHARDVQGQARGPGVTAVAWYQDSALIAVLYIVAFSLFIYGLSGLTGPRTAVRGNMIAAVGMAVAVVATFLSPRIGTWG